MARKGRTSWHARLFAMKRESWARLVRVSSVARYTPSRRIAKRASAEKAGSFFSLFRGQQRRGSRPGSVRSVHFQPVRFHPSRVSCVAHYQRRAKAACSTVSLSSARVLSVGQPAFDYVHLSFPPPPAERPLAQRDV